MGKVKRTRQKVHTAAVKVKTNTDNGSTQMDTGGAAAAKQPTVPGPIPAPSLDTNLFAGLDLSKYKMTSTLPDLDARSAITSKSLKDVRIKKKDKQKLRHDLWMQKLNAVEAMKKQEKERKRKQQTPVVGDIGALGDMLPTLELLMKKPTKLKGPREKSTKVRGIQKEKNRKKQMESDLGIFQQVLKHPAYKEDASSTISEHIRNRQRQEDMES